MGNVLDIWKKQYGDEVAVRMWKEKVDRQRATNKSRMEAMTTLERSTKFGNSGTTNPMYGKSFYDVWVETYGKREANKRMKEWNIQNNSINELRSIRMTGDNNPLKDKIVAEKISKSRKEYFKNPVNRLKSSLATIKQIEDGRSSSGYTKNYKYIANDGIEYTLQGTYELAFIKWLDNNKMSFTCHKGRIPYKDECGHDHIYLPDFWVNEWNTYVDIKSTYWYIVQADKFKSILQSNPKLKLRIILETELKELGIL